MHGHFVRYDAVGHGDFIKIAILRLGHVRIKVRTQITVDQLGNGIAVPHNEHIFSGICRYDARQ